MNQSQETAVYLSEAFKETEIGALPESWAIKSLGELFDVQQGKALSQMERAGISPRPFLRTINVLWGKVDLTTIDQMDFTEEEAKRLSLKPGDLLICEGGEIGRSAVWNRPDEGICYQNHVHRLRRKHNEIVPDFVMYWMQAAFLLLRLYGGVGNKTTIPNLSGSRLKQLLIPVPSFLEQRAIGAVLSKIQAAVEVQDKIVATLKELKAATMAKLFREGLRGEPLKQTETGEMPESWLIKRFGDFATLHRGYDLPVHQRNSGKVPVVGSNGIVGYHDKAMVKGPGVCTGRSGTMGLSFYCETDFWPLNTALFVVDFHGNDQLFVHYFFERFDFEQFAAGVSVPTLNRNLVHETMIAVPNLEDQIQIASTLQDIDTAITLAEKRCTTLKSLFSSILHLLMTGRVRATGLMNSLLKI
jgi:type I restriction enzyme S subunit